MHPSTHPYPSVLVKNKHPSSPSFQSPQNLIKERRKEKGRKKPGVVSLPVSASASTNTQTDTHDQRKEEGEATGRQTAWGKRDVPGGWDSCGGTEAGKEEIEQRERNGGKANKRWRVHSCCAFCTLQLHPFVLPFCIFLFFLSLSLSPIPLFLLAFLSSFPTSPTTKKTGLVERTQKRCHRQAPQNRAETHPMNYHLSIITSKSTNTTSHPHRLSPAKRRLSRSIGTPQ